MRSLLLTVVLLLVASCAAKQEPAAEQQASAKSGEGIPEISDVQARKGLAPNFTWQDAKGKPASFDQFHKKVTVLNFWATWCGPCRREIPDLEAIHKEYGNKGVQVIGVSLDQGPAIKEDVKKFVDDYKMTYPVVIDNGDLQQMYGNIRAIPTTFIIDKDGKIVERLIGMRSKEDFLKSILAHLD